MIERNYGIDLLKIVLAFMVIILHIYANGTGQVLMHSTTQPFKAISIIVTYLCYPAVNTYILITGYFLYSAKKKLPNIIKSLTILWLSAVFFSLIGYFAAVIFGNNFDLCNFIKHFFPITRGVWWFYTVYFALLIFSPFINKLIDTLTPQELKILLFIQLLVFSILPIFVDWKDQIGSNYGYSLIWFIALYTVGAFIYRIKLIQNNSRKMFTSMMVLYAACTLSLYLLPKIFSFVGICVNFAMYNSLIVLVQAIALFIGFSNVKIPNIFLPWISFFSGCALASYLLHCQEDIELLLWNKIHPSTYANSLNILFIIIFICFGVFSVSIILEFTRKKIFGLLKIDKFFIFVFSKIFTKVEKLIAGKEVL